MVGELKASRDVQSGWMGLDRSHDNIVPGLFFPKSIACNGVANGASAGAECSVAFPQRGHLPAPKVSTS